MTIPYDEQYDPAAPVLSATLSGMVRQRPLTRFSALIDTGSDMTAIPVSAVKRLRLYAVAQIAVEGIHAQAEMVDIYMVRLSIANLPAREMEVVPTEQPFVLLGRDWLESYYLFLNGPENNFLLSDTPLLENI